MIILAAFYKNISESANPNLTQEFDYVEALCSLEKTFNKFNPVGKFILATDTVTNIKVEADEVF
jgi:serine/threonine protein phosphatase PrpC